VLQASPAARAETMTGMTVLRWGRSAAAVPDRKVEDGGPGVLPGWSEPFELPPYSLWRRVPEWEPRGRWLRDRPQVAWPDTMFAVAWMPWVMRALLAVSFVLGEVTLTGGLGRHLLLALLTALLLGWIEWWGHWDLSPLSRRLLVNVVQLGLLAAIIAVSPLGGFIVWMQYAICGSFFTGPLLIASLLVSCSLITSVQMGGFSNIGAPWEFPIGLFLLDVLIGLVSIGLANRREEAVWRRNAAAARLLAEQRTNAQLHQQLVDQAREAGVREERARLARDLHDTVAQGLVAVITQLEAIDDAGMTDAATRRRVENAKALARTGLGEARRAVHALRPIVLDGAPLPTALRAMLDEWAAVNPARTELIVSGQPRATRADPTLIRTTQEALANVARHAQAGRVVINLDYLEDEVLLDIHDDGLGFDPSATASPSQQGGHGLPGMADRLRVAGGTLSVESEPGSGAVISAAVPG
jgi:signal transduction histidine kinase